MANASAMSVQAVSGQDVERFTAGKVEKRKLVVERLAASILGALTIGLVLPLLAILGLLVVKAWPALSWEFLTQNPQSYMTAGGIWEIGRASCRERELAGLGEVGAEERVVGRG